MTVKLLVPSERLLQEVDAIADILGRCIDFVSDPRGQLADRLQLLSLAELHLHVFSSLLLLAEFLLDTFALGDVYDVNDKVQWHFLRISQQTDT